MSLMDRLREVGGKLGLLQVAAPAKNAGPAKITTRSISLAELESEVVVAGIDALGRERSELSADFGALYVAAGIQPPKHGWTVEKLIAALREPTLAGKPRAEVQAAILERLRADGAATEDVVRDAMARDRAVDAYAEQVRGRLVERNRDRALRRREIDQELARLNAERERLDADGRTEAQRWADWWARKRDHEEAMAWAIDHLLEGAPASNVSIDREPPPLDR
jgi:hypothetical protein